jgi:hypothetical protein
MLELFIWVSWLDVYPKGYAEKVREIKMDVLLFVV